MSDPRHRLEPAVASDTVASYDPPIAIRSIDFDAVAPPRTPALYTPPPSTHVPTGAGPDQWAESATPESDRPTVDDDRSDEEPSSSETDDLELAHS